MDTRKDYAAFLNSANYPLVKQTDMTAEERDSAVDICIVAVEKHSSDMEKCTQASRLIGFSSQACLTVQAQQLLRPAKVAGHKGCHGQEVWASLAYCGREVLLI